MRAADAGSFPSPPSWANCWPTSRHLLIPPPQPPARGAASLPRPAPPGTHSCRGFLLVSAAYPLRLLPPQTGTGAPTPLAPRSALALSPPPGLSPPPIPPPSPPPSLPPRSSSAAASSSSPAAPGFSSWEVARDPVATTTTWRGAAGPPPCGPAWQRARRPPAPCRAGPALGAPSPTPPSRTVAWRGAVCVGAVCGPCQGSGAALIFALGLYILGASEAIYLDFLIYFYFLVFAL